jgi:hypothetical protein
MSGFNGGFKNLLKKERKTIKSFKNGSHFFETLLIVEF